MSRKKEKKEKIIYIDDGSSIADMSNIKGGMEWSRQGTRSSFRDIWRTYWSAVGMMIRPMLVVVGFLLAVFSITALIFWLI